MRKKAIAGAAVILAVIAAAAVTLRARTDQDRGVLRLTGTVEVEEVDVAFKVAGRIEELLTDEGRTVERGDIVALLDRAEFESQVAQSRASLKNARALQEQAKKDLARYEELYAKGILSAQQLDAARTGFETASAQSQQAAAALRSSQVRLADAAIRAPLRGVVLRKNAERGETVTAGTPVFTIADLESPWIRVYVKEDRLGRVKLGQTAGVSVDSFPEKTYAGTVTFISSEAEFTPKNVQTREERVKLVFGVKVSVKNEHDELKPGMPADVTILLNAAEQ